MRIKNSETIDEILEAMSKIECLKKISRTDYSVMRMVMEIAQNKGHQSLYNLYHKEKYKQIAKDGAAKYDHSYVWKAVEKARIAGYVSKIKEKKKIIIKLNAKGRKMAEDLAKDFENMKKRYVK